MTDNTKIILTYKQLKQLLFEDIDIGHDVKSNEFYIKILDDFINSKSKFKKEQKSKDFIKNLLKRLDKIASLLTKISCGLMLDSISVLNTKYADNQTILNKAGEMLDLELDENGLFNSDKYIDYETEYYDILEAIEICKTYALKKFKKQ